MIRAVVAASAAILISFPLAAQNRLVNPGFDEADQLNGWSCFTTQGAVTWSTEDRAISTSSGSMQHDVTSSSSNQKVWCTQCIPVTEFESYIASMWVYWPDDPDVTQVGSPRIEIDYHANTTCDSFLHLGDIQVGYPLYDTWNFLGTNPSTAPAGAQSALLYLFTWQDVANEPVRARIDDVDFQSTAIFHDGFESGNTNTWNP